MSSKVRYYMELSVPELDDLNKKGLFDRKEITMIMRRRTDYEYRIQGRGSKPRDYLKYAEFEISLEKLRIKRYQRLKTVDMVDTKPSISDWAGFRKIVFVFDRAVKRYPGDLEIWSRYLQFVKDKDAVKVVYRVYAKLLLLQPRNVDAWLLAAKYEFDVNANAKGARDLYQRALRMNPESFKLWLSYAQFELAYVLKLLARRKVMGLLTEKQQKDDLAAQESELQKRKEKGTDGVAGNDDMVTLNDVDGDEMRSELALLPEADISVLGNPDSNPVLKGDIALTIFDLCIPELLQGVASNLKEDKVFEIANDFLDMFEKFPTLNREYLYHHILRYLQTNYAGNTRTATIDITLTLRGISVGDADLAENLQLSVNKFNAYKAKAKSDAEKKALTDFYINYLEDNFVNSPEEKLDRVVMLLKAIIQKCR
ncbi:CIC11C00000004270 [Sungouiella intermedia]|uniref:CIC11C00000004270 n=1 Tax=Sungouiella intermedia TaxID=45354 RepID=A0A1L0BKU5_9ASCO|nr:CIC11C00000004270 [[Candida] intermedia]